MKVIPIHNDEQRKAAQGFLAAIGPRHAEESNLSVGRHLDIPFKKYLSDPAISHSGIETYLETVGREVVLVPTKKARERQLHPDPPTAAMKLGSLVHAIVLEPSDYEKRYRLRPSEKTERSKLEAAGIEIVPADRWDKAHRMAAAVHANAEMDAYLEMAAATEVTYRWDLNVEGQTVACRCRPDWEFEDEIIFDLKTGFDMSDQGWRRRVRKYGFDRGAAWYLSGAAELGLPFRRYVFACVESVEPYLTCLREIDEARLDAAATQNDGVLQIHARCMANDNWDGYPGGIIKLLDDERGGRG